MIMMGIGYELSFHVTVSLVLQEGEVIEEGAEDLLLEDHNIEFLSQDYLQLEVGKILRIT